MQKIQDNYFSFLDYRAAQRQLTAKFAHPRGLLLHTLAFIVSMSAAWAYAIAWRWWMTPQNFILPVLAGVLWSLLLVTHALIHYRRSAARAEQRELAVEAEMRRLFEKRDDLDHEELFALHRRFEADLEQQGRWSTALTAFAFANAASWWVSSLNIGSSWPFQTTPLMALLIIGGVQIFLLWQQRRRDQRVGWFTRLPLRHIVAYAAGAVGLGLAGAYRLINRWDAENGIIVWGVALLLHIVVSVIVWPLIQRVLPGAETATPEKRKPPARLVLSDDGEMLDIREVGSAADAEDARLNG